MGQIIFHGGPGADDGQLAPGAHRIAHELLSDCVLDNTFEDLPSPARKLLELIKKYLQGKSKRDNIPVEKIIFEKREIMEYTSWSFAQVKNNFRTLRDCLPFRAS